MIRRALPVLGLLTLVALPAQAQHVASIENARSGQVISLEPGDDPDEMICRRQPPTVGSRLGAKRTCATRAQWHDFDVRRAFARRAVEVAQQQRPCTGDGAGGGATCR
jgi:hypothetical protein